MTFYSKHFQIYPIWADYSCFPSSCLSLHNYHKVVYQNVSLISNFIANFLTSVVKLQPGEVKLIWKNVVSKNKLPFFLWLVLVIFYLGPFKLHFVRSINIFWIRLIYPALKIAINCLKIGFIWTRDRKFATTRCLWRFATFCVTFLFSCHFFRNEVI